MLEAMDEERARELVAGERARVELALANLRGEGVEESDDRVDPGDRGSENLYQDEFDEGRAQDLQRELEAVERAEARLAAGTYGLSVQSGEPIPDARLEAFPTAERTVAEEGPYGGA
jgi:DnaK suppressor protein